MVIVALTFGLIVCSPGQHLPDDRQGQPHDRGPVRRCRAAIESFAIIRRSASKYTFRFNSHCPATATVGFGIEPARPGDPPEFPSHPGSGNGVLVPGYSDGLTGYLEAHNIDADLVGFAHIDYYILQVFPKSGGTLYRTGRISQEAVSDPTGTVGGSSPNRQGGDDSGGFGRFPHHTDLGGDGVFELRCRGGGRQTFNVTQGQPLPTGETMMNLTLNFSAGSEAVSRDGRNLSPGQCSWLDRSFRPGEPTQLRMQVVDFAQLRQQQHGDPVDRSATAAERYPDARNIPPYLRDTDHYWSFFVSDTKQGFLQVNSSKFWRPLHIIGGPGSANPNYHPPGP
jgi:hypothetical protein